MNPRFGGGDPEFTDGLCTVGGHIHSVASSTQEFCPDGQQNAHAELMAMFGPARGEYT